MMLKILISAMAIVLLATTAQAAERPNIVLVMADDQGWGEEMRADFSSWLKSVVGSLNGNDYASE